MQWTGENVLSNEFDRLKIELKLVRMFGIGFEVLDPYWNDLYIRFHFTFFMLCFWSKGDKWFGFRSYWDDNRKIQPRRKLR